MYKAFNNLRLNLHHFIPSHLVICAMGWFDDFKQATNVGMQMATQAPSVALDVVTNVATHPEGPVGAFKDPQNTIVKPIMQNSPVTNSFESQPGEMRKRVSRADWMRDRRSRLDSKRIDEIVLPGTHDSGTYDLSLRSSPDAPPVVATLSSLPVTNERIRGWAKAQSLNFVEQLDLGVRYFDLRVGVSRNDQSLRIFHSVESNQTLREMFNTIRPWMDAHNGEIIVLHVKRAMGFAGNQAKYNELISNFNDVFGSLLAPSSYFWERRTYSHYVTTNRRVIAVFDNNEDINPPSGSPDWVWKYMQCMAEGDSRIREPSSIRLHIVGDVVWSPTETPSTASEIADYATLDLFTWGAGRHNKNAKNQLDALPLSGKGWIIPMDYPEFPDRDLMDYIVGLNGN
ncbi:PLC-like phosphodiesterase [Clavulina sp. PMI_390]|nr:PLC-like phosphodiesterase [Clavulina sp. PMI_390]